MNNINVTIHYYEGFSYVEYNGEFFKGCRRCGGTGHYSFDGFDSLCYLCRDTAAKLGDHIGTEADAIKWIEGKAKARAQRDRKREEVRLAKLRKRDTAWQALKDEHPAVWELLSNTINISIPFEDGQGGGETTERDPFVRSLAEKMWRLDEIGFSPRQLEALENVVAKRAAKATEQAATPAPEGRVVVTGEIMSTKAVEGDYGTAYKIRVKDDRGFQVWVSIPRAQADSAYDDFTGWVENKGYNLFDFGPECWFSGTQNGSYPGVKGRRITFTATLQPSRDDVSFAFGSRPTKGSWI